MMEGGRGAAIQMKEGCLRQFDNEHPDTLTTADLASQA